MGLTLAEDSPEDFSEAKASGTTEKSSKSVGTVGTILLLAYLIGSLLLILFTLAQLWPHPTPAGELTATEPPQALLGLNFTVTPEVRLLLIVGLSGALGGLVHSLRSL